jgi:hypothetical protein
VLQFSYVLSYYRQSIRTALALDQCGLFAWIVCFCADSRRVMLCIGSYFEGDLFSCVFLSMSVSTVSLFRMQFDTNSYRHQILTVNN